MYTHIYVILFKGITFIYVILKTSFMIKLMFLLYFLCNAKQFLSETRIPNIHTKVFFFGGNIYNDLLYTLVYIAVL